jgi:hypothetical protein
MSHRIANYAQVAVPHETSRFIVTKVRFCRRFKHLLTVVADDVNRDSARSEPLYRWGNFTCRKWLLTYDADIDIALPDLRQPDAL